MNQVPAFMHAVSIAHGIGASVACAAVFYLAGIFILPRSREGASDGIAPALIGAALYVVLCWFGVARGIPVSRLALIFGSAVVLIGIAGHRRIRARLSNPVFRSAVRQWFIVFALLYLVAYLFTMPSATSDRLPVAWTGNVDLMTYVRYTRYFLHLGPSNLTDFSYVNYVYLQTPGLFYLLGAFSLLFDSDPLSAAMPVQFALVALIGAMVAAISRSVFNLSLRASFAIACIFVSGPFFRYVAANYFLSTLMALPILLYLLRTTIQQRADRLVAPSLALRFGAAYVLLLFIYPFLLFAGIGLQVAAILLRLLAELQRRETKPVPGSAMAGAFNSLATAVAVCIAVAVLFWTRLAWSVEMIVSLSEAGIAGWPLRFISPQAMFAWPGIRSGAMQVAAASQPLATASFGAIAVALVAAYFWWFRSRTTPAQSAWAGLLAFGIILYCAYYAAAGASYQQWKFASYSVLPLSFVLIAAIAQALSSPALVARIAGSPGDRRLLAAFPGFIAAAVIAGNAAAHAAYDPPLRRLPGNLRAISDMDKVESFREITVRMNDAPDSLPTSVALYYLPNKTVHVVSTRFTPSAPLSLETVSRQRPLFMHNFGCEGVGHDETMSVRGVGCLLYAPPSPQLGVTYPYNRTFLFMTYEGMTARTTDGRWNSRPSVPLKVLIDPERTPVGGPAYLNLFLRAKEAARPQNVTFRWSRDQRVETTIASEEWVSIPVRSSDWTGNRLWTLAVMVDVPEVGGLLFRELSITESPRGRVLR